jgi:hypothetical protein
MTLTNRTNVNRYKRVFVILLSLIGILILIILVKTIIFPDYIRCFRQPGYEGYHIRIDAANSLILKGDKIVPYLCGEYSRRSDIEEKCGILYVLGNIGGDEVMDTIMRAIKDANPKIRATGIASLKNMTPNEINRSFSKSESNKELPASMRKYYRALAQLKLDKWPIKKEAIRILTELLYNKNRVGSTFPYGDYNEFGEIRNAVIYYLGNLMDYNEFNKNIIEIRGGVLKWLDTEEKWLAATNFVQKYWKENEPYLYWTDNKKGLYDKKLIIHYDAKLLGVPVDEITGKMIDLKDKHPLTQEEINKIRDNR